MVNSSLDGLRSRAQQGPSGTTHADAFNVCSKQHMLRVALLYRRPVDHPFFELVISQRCGLRLFPIWKSGTTLLAQLIDRPAGSQGGHTNRSLCAQDALNMHDHAPFSLDTMKTWHASRTIFNRKKGLHLVHATAGLFSVALTREPTERFLHGYHEHFARRQPSSHRPAANATESTPAPLAARLSSLEDFVEQELAIVPTSTSLPPKPNSFERDFHLAPQVAFLTQASGERHRLN